MDDFTITLTARLSGKLRYVSDVRLEIIDASPPPALGHPTGRVDDFTAKPSVEFRHISDVRWEIKHCPGALL